MIRLRLDEVAAATGGRLAGGADPGALIEGPVVIDSREVTAGALFVALAGERLDGHDYAAAACGAGAVAVLAARELTGPDGAAVPTVVVDDPQRALAALARAVRHRLPGLEVVAVTGSSGKTGTKDLLAQVLAAAGETVAPRESFNNELGVPLTLLRCDEHTRYLVSEMGAREPGNIAYLCDIVAPRIGVVLNVGAAHAGVFGTREATAATKGELVEALPADGIAVLNADDPAVAAMAQRTAARVVRTGTAPASEAGVQIRAVGITLDDDARPAFTLLAQGDSAPVRLRLHGRHHVANALAVAAVAISIGMDVPRVAGLLSAATARSSGRMTVHRRRDGVVVIDDAYNANPDSVAAALAALVAMTDRPDRPDRAGRSWAVLGEMLELGEQSVAEHDRLGRLAASLGVDHLVAVGPGARPIHEGALGVGGHSAAVQGPDEAEAVLRQGVRPGDVVLVKASRAIGLDRLAARLIGEGQEPGETPVPGILPLRDGAAGEDGARASGPAAARTPGEVGA